MPPCVVQVPQLRAERKGLAVDPRFNHVVQLVRSGYFGWEDYFGPIMDAITSGGDYYLVANDFPSYLAEQVCVGGGEMKGQLHRTLACD